MTTSPMPDLKCAHDFLSTAVWNYQWDRKAPDFHKKREVAYQAHLDGVNVLNAVWELDDIAYFKIVHVQFRHLTACLDLIAFLDELAVLPGDKPQVGIVARIRRRWYNRYARIDASERPEITRLKNFE